MKRVDLIRHLARHGCYLDREGANHAIYRNPANGRCAAVPRHREIKESNPAHAGHPSRVAVPRASVEGRAMGLLTDSYSFTPRGASRQVAGRGARQHGFPTLAVEARRARQLARSLFPGAWTANSDSGSSRRCSSGSPSTHADHK